MFQFWNYVSARLSRPARPSSEDPWPPVFLQIYTICNHVSYCDVIRVYTLWPIYRFILDGLPSYKMGGFSMAMLVITRWYFADVWNRLNGSIMDFAEHTRRNVPIFICKKSSSWIISSTNIPSISNLTISWWYTVSHYNHIIHVYIFIMVFL